MIAWVVVTSLIVFVVLLRSLVLPLLTVVVNLLTIAMSYGMLVLLFQGTTFEKILRFTSTGGIDAVVPVVLLCILFGITMDYAVFMLTRTHERWNRHPRQPGQRDHRHRQDRADHRQRGACWWSS